MENRAGFFAEAGIRGILDRGGEESAFQRVVRAFMFPASILFFFFAVQINFLTSFLFYIAAFLQSTSAGLDETWGKKRRGRNRSG